VLSLSPVLLDVICWWFWFCQVNREQPLRHRRVLREHDDVEHVHGLCSVVTLQGSDGHAEDMHADHRLRRTNSNIVCVDVCACVSFFGCECRTEYRTELNCIACVAEM
jgi:hypothetical protein